jgi:hypothetical protein
MKIGVALTRRIGLRSVRRIGGMVLLVWAQTAPLSHYRIIAISTHSFLELFSWQYSTTYIAQD